MQYREQAYAVDIETCLDGVGKVGVIACMEQPPFGGNIPRHVQRREILAGLPARASPGCSKLATGPRHLPAGNFQAGTEVEYYSTTDISMPSRLSER